MEPSPVITTVHRLTSGGTKTNEAEESGALQFPAACILLCRFFSDCDMSLPVIGCFL